MTRTEIEAKLAANPALARRNPHLTRDRPTPAWQKEQIFAGDEAWTQAKDYAELHGLRVVGTGSLTEDQCYHFGLDKFLCKNDVHYCCAAILPESDSPPARPLGGPPDSGGLAASQGVAAGRGWDRLNKLESAFLAYLTLLPGVRWIGPHHGLSFEIGDKCRYRPDFVTQDDAGKFSCWEVKGGWVSRDASVRIRSAARQWPGFAFWWVTRGKDGKWNMEEIKS